MLTNEQYEILINLQNNIKIDEDSVYQILLELEKMDFIRSTDRKRYGMSERHSKFIITEKGKSACVEYEKSLRQENREIKTLEIAEEANKKSDKANQIAKWSLITSVFSALIAIVAIIVAAGV